MLVLGGVVYEKDLLYEARGRTVDDGMHRPKQGRPGLVVKHDHDGRRGQLGGVALGLASEETSFD